MTDETIGGGLSRPELPRVLRSVREMRSYARSLAAGGESLGLVPTMGYLHEGHLSLMRRAREENGAVVASIFVNPLQFGPAEDLESYPRDFDRDRELAAEVGVAAIFAPEPGELYPAGFTSEVRVRGLEDRLEGAARPGHFAGVATVLTKLMNIVGPDRMYMGQKDAQQAVVVRRMIRDLDFRTELVVCPIVREEDGLALSSRNVYLSVEERRAAVVISRGLSRALGSGSRDPAYLEGVVRREIGGEALARLEYVSANDAATLGLVCESTEGILLSCAVRVGKTRLIDNVLVPGSGKPDPVKPGFR